MEKPLSFSRFMFKQTKAHRVNLKTAVTLRGPEVVMHLLCSFIGPLLSADIVVFWRPQVYDMAEGESTRNTRDPTPPLEDDVLRPDDDKSKYAFETSDDIRKKIMRSVSTKWRQFKANLTSNYVFGRYKDKSPCVAYAIDEETWSQFVKTRTDPKWEEIRKKAKFIAAKNDTPHRLSRGGYDLLERRILEEKLKRRQGESPSIEHICPPSPPDRCDLWVLARTTSGGNMTSERTLQVSQRIAELKQQIS
ncbi:hypothetical protein VNO80_08995 [Phaseolus coccineus]|uniref:Uncharacterized protein n=1 Tax=Phaseolus coccineus TaxID=3886 RepID=A0AAN9N5D5_PHACN